MGMSNAQKALEVLDNIIEVTERTAGATPPEDDRMLVSMKALRRFMTGGEVSEDQPMVADRFASVSLWMANLMAASPGFLVTMLGVMSRLPGGQMSMKVLEKGQSQEEDKVSLEVLLGLGGDDANNPRKVN